MDSKKWYKRLSTCCWFALAFAPVIYALGAVILQWFSHLPENTDLMLQNTTTLKNFTFNFFDYFENAMGGFGPFVPSWLFDWAEELCDNIQCGYQIGYFVAWFVWVYIVELICDIIVWLPKFFHKWLNKVGE